jgi:hypothetical protein
LECDGPVEATIKTDNLYCASRVILTCKTADCGFVFSVASPTTASLQDEEDDHEQTTDYAINIMYITGFLSVGDGGTEAARILGMLSLPNDTTMETRSFHTIEERINPKMEKLALDILLEIPIEEVRQTLKALHGNDNGNDFGLWKDSILKQLQLLLFRTRISTHVLMFGSIWVGNNEAPATGTRCIQDMQFWWVPTREKLLQ